MYWSHLTIQAETSTSKRNHTSTCDTDTSPLTERLSFTSNSRETESKGRDIKKLPRIFFSHHFISAFPTSPSPQTPNHQPSGLACHCWVSHSPSEGPQTFFLSLCLSFSLLFWRICHFIRACRSHQSANFIVQMGSGAGRLPGFLRKGEALAWLCRAVCTPTSHSWSVLILGPPPPCPLRTRDALEVSGLFARTLGSP